VTERYDDHRIDEMLRGLAAETRPATAEELVEARRPLAQAILNEQRRARSRRRRHPAWTIAVAAAVILAAVSAVQLRKPSRLEAALDQYAEVVSLTEPLTPISGQYIFQESHHENLAVFNGDGLVVYLAVVDRSIWVGEGNTITEAETNREPQFFSASEQQRYDAAGIAEVDHVGETLVHSQLADSLDDYPTEPKLLVEYLRAQDALGLPSTSEDAELFLDLKSILTNPIASGELRAAAARAIVSVRGVELVDQSDSAITIAIEYTRIGHVQETLVLDLARAQITLDTTVLLDDMENLDIPAGSVIGSVTYGPITLTTEGPPPNNP
jgi:hypothetical protein